jgi:serine/threonine protein kinase
MDMQPLLPSVFTSSTASVASAPVIPVLGVNLPPFVRPKIDNYITNKVVFGENSPSGFVIQVRVGDRGKVIDFLDPDYVTPGKEDEYISVAYIGDFTVRRGFINIEEASVALGVDKELIVKSSNGNFKNLLSILAKPLTSTKTVLDVYNETVLVDKVSYCRKIADLHKRLDSIQSITKENFEACVKYFNENRKTLEERFAAEKALDPNKKCLVLKKSETKLPFNIEFREDSIRIHVIKELCIGSSNKLSLHVEPSMGLVFLKSKRIIKLSNIKDKGFRKISLELVLNEAKAINALRNLEGFVQYFFAPEVVMKNKNEIPVYKFHTYLECLSENNLLEVFNDKTRVPYTLGQRMSMFLTLCRYVREMHQRKILHRDIKLENIVLHTESTGTMMKFVDPEFATEIDQIQSISHGSNGYMDPISIYYYLSKIYQSKLTAAADVYALGVILYIFFYGDFPILSKMLINNNLAILFKNVMKMEGYNIEMLNKLLDNSIAGLERNKINPKIITIIRSMLDPKSEKRIALDLVINNLSKIPKDQITIK